MNNLLNPANPISPLNPINPISPLHEGLFKSPSDTVYDMAMAAATSYDIPMFVLGMFLGIVLTLILCVFIFAWKKG